MSANATGALRASCETAQENPKSPPPLLGRLLKPREVADALRISPSMVRALTRRGELPAVYIGRLPRYQEADVTAYLNQQRVRRASR